MARKNSNDDPTYRAQTNNIKRHSTATRNYESQNLLQRESESDPFTEDRYRQFYKFFAKDSVQVLDVGCNTGRGGKVLKELKSDLLISGLDTVAERLRKLPKDAYIAGLYGQSAALPCEDCTFDVVVAGEFIEHLYAFDVQLTLSEVFRVLKVGGRFLLTTPNPEDIKRKWRNGSILGGAHVSQHFYPVLKLQLMMTGFSNVRGYGSGKVSRYLGSGFPLFIYGSYLAVAEKF